MDAVFKKIHEGIDLFNYHFTRHENSTNDSQREKLENDLKKEIKKLQKFRDQIKTWQLNDQMEAIIAPSKLQDHRKLVEEAMECYKEVEKNSKMKSFSNQSIMLAALESGDNDLSEEVLDAVHYLNDIIENLNEQVENLNDEYEKISAKKIRKNNLSAIEERKQEIEKFQNNDNFHIEKIETIIQYLKNGKLSPDSIWLIQDDLNFYVESNQDPDFIDDETLYDEIIKEAKQNTDRINSEIEHERRQKQQREENSINEDDIILLKSKKSNDLQSSSSSPSNSNTLPPSITRPSSSSSKQSPQPELPKQKLGSSGVTTPKTKPAQLQSTSSIPATPELSSPAIIKTLKPATAPPKPVGTLKWAAAAAGNDINTNSETVSHQVPKNDAVSNGHLNGSISNGIHQTEKDKRSDIKNDLNQPSPASQIINDINASTPPTKSTKPEDDPNFKFVEILKNSSLSNTELELFSDLYLIKLPPGIQDLIISFTSTRKVGPSTEDNSKLLIKEKKYNHFKIPIHKPYLPDIVQLSSSLNNYDFSQLIKPPLQLLKLQNSWNSIRAQNQFDKFVEEIKSIINQNNPENLNFVNELTLVLFYGLYYGLTPLENLIAETCLFLLGWKPYGTKIALPDQLSENTTSNNNNNNQSPTKLSAFDKSTHQPRHYYYWFKCIKNHPNPSMMPIDNQIENVEYGDYQVFDLFAWDIRIKYNFRFDISLCQLNPSISIC